MTNEQKQKVMQLLELCIYNNKDGEYACTFDAYPSNYGSVTVRVYLAGDNSSFGESYSISTEFDRDDAKLDAAIAAIRTLPERAPALIAAKEEAQREKLLKEYEEVFGNITIWDRPDSTVKTVAGTVTYRKWCEMEIECFAKNGKATRLLTCKTPSGEEQICIGRA